MSRAVHFIVAVALFAASNLHLPVLQVVAWTGMIVSYSQGRTVSEAVRMTFDGEHPCPMCKAIKKQQTEQPQQLQVASPTMRLMAVWEPPDGYEHIRIMVDRLGDFTNAWASFSWPPERLPPRVQAIFG